MLDAVGSGVAEVGHTAAFYWQGKQPAAAFYTTAFARKVHDSYSAFRDRSAAWSRISIKAVLEAREG